MREGHRRAPERSAKDEFYRVMPLEVLEACIHDRRGEFAGLVDSLNFYTQDRRRQPVAISEIWSADPERPGLVIQNLIAKKDVTFGRFEEFVLDEEHGIAVRMFVDLMPDSSPGLLREETMKLWHPEEQALRWPTFDYQPPGRPGFWRRALRLAT